MAPLDAVLGQKVGMTQLFEPDGRVRPVTVIRVGPCVVLQVKDAKRDGYQAVQLGLDDKKKVRASKAETGHAAKAKTAPKRFVREVGVLGAESGVEVGQAIGVDILEGTQRVDVIGVSKGRGWGGTMKRHNFQGGPKTHGSKSHRKAGSIGMHTFPSRVLKGQRMSGHYGNARSTVKNLRIVRIDKDSGYLFVGGGIPGPSGGYVVVRRCDRECRAVPAGGKP